LLSTSGLSFFDRAVDLNPFHADIVLNLIITGFGAAVSGPASWARFSRPDIEAGVRKRS
jgi:hypothetical protein